MKKTLGGDRLGSGKKMQVYLEGYERSTHNKGRVWKSSMSCGTLVPCLVEIALPGDTWEIRLKAFANTHPTLGPLFGSFKLQVDIFETAMRLYMAKLHNNKTGIGMKMDTIKMPVYTHIAPVWDDTINDKDNSQINPSCILAYLGQRGIGRSTTPDHTRDFNALAWLIYWDKYKNYYSNKQEQIGVVIHTPIPALPTNVSGIGIAYDSTSTPVAVPQAPSIGTVYTSPLAEIYIDYTGTAPNLNTIVFKLADGRTLSANQLGYQILDTGTQLTLFYNFNTYGDIIVSNWDYGVTEQPIQLYKFDLEQIDNMREYIMTQATASSAVQLNIANLEPWSLMLDDNQPAIMSSQEGLGIKTYQSDLYNNWLLTEWIEGPTGIAALTAVDTSSGKFTQEQFLFSKKLYDMLNRIAVSGGTYDDWIDAVWTHDRFTRSETPMYMGGMIQELAFQEVISNSEAQPSTTGGAQPLGTLAGKGTLTQDRKGGQVTIKTNEPSMITGVVSLTPRLDYCQGNDWWIHLKTMDDLHKPGMDGIGFQDLITEQMAWWDTHWDSTKWVQKSAGKQPAYVNYMTAVNEVHGNFAVIQNEGFMVLTRRYEYDVAEAEIADLTTYIDPTKFNHIFADTRLDAQNFWIQIGIDITVRRKMSAKLMPNL